MRAAERLVAESRQRYAVRSANGLQAGMVKALVGGSVQSLLSPTLVVDLDAMERNMTLMKTTAAALQVRLRPHLKAHKCPSISKLLIDAGGAVGVCCQKVSEAEVAAAAGIKDVFVSNEVIGVEKLLRLVDLAFGAPDIAVSLCVDSMTGVEQLISAVDKWRSGATELPPTKVGVFIEVNVGQNRCGLPASPTPDGSWEVFDVATRILSRPDALTLAGLQAYNGAAQHIRSVAEKQRAVEASVDKARGARALLEERGIHVPLVTGGGTGTFTLEAGSAVYGEIQPGSYLFMDAEYAKNEPVPQAPVFEHALFLKATVISANYPGRVVLDAGHKSSAIDTGLPVARGLAELGVTCENGGDDHTVLVGPPAVLRALRPGSTVWLVPNHVDPTFNLHDFAVGVRGGLEEGRVEAVFDIAARGHQW